MISFGSDFGKTQEEFSSTLAFLDGVSSPILDKLVPAFQEVAEDVATRSKANAPILKDVLRPNIRADNVVVGADKISVNVISDTPYSLRQHEELQPYGAGPLNLGPISSQQPPTPEGGVGGKFIERVVQFHLKRYQDLIIKRFKEALGRTGRSKRSSR